MYDGFIVTHDIAISVFSNVLIASMPASQCTARYCYSNSVCPSVHPHVWNTPVLCPNG